MKCINVLLCWVLIVLAPSCKESVAVSKENFARAESQWHFARFVERGGLGHFYHYRQLGILDQPGMRPNVDAYHSVGVFDLDAGPVTISLPEGGERYQSMSIINEDNLIVSSVYAPGDFSYTREEAGSRYIIAIVRLFVDGDIAIDSQIVHTLQDEIRVRQAATGEFDMPRYDTNSQRAMRDRLRTLSAALPVLRRAAGRRQEVDPEQHLAATASDWGLPDDEDALFFHEQVPDNDGQVAFQLLLTTVPVDGFWSVSVSDANGQLPQGDYNRYSLNNTTAHLSPDGSVLIRFGSCDTTVANCLPIFPGWHYTVRLYRPRRAVLDSSWVLPPLQRIISR